MPEPVFALGADVVPEVGYRGTVIEVRWINESEWIYGVVSTNGQIQYYRERALKSAAGML